MKDLYDVMLDELLGENLDEFHFGPTTPLTLPRLVGRIDDPQVRESWRAAAWPRRPYADQDMFLLGDEPTQAERLVRSARDRLGQGRPDKLAVPRDRIETVV